ncbi:MAG: hypothetical protein A2V64_00115 [Bacteroidetes bacterium RBG_13_43_22]|nr:MAG: hypothetical protein A2V64_00115 [Bacteroidetes bacterium RBG_13_43_22]
METNRIADITLKEIFEKFLGEENAHNVLSNIQVEYDKGTRGEELENYANQEIQKYTQRIILPIPIAIVRIFQ